MDSKTEKKETIYVVQGRSGIVFIATTNYDEAKEMKESLNVIESDRAILSHWINGKHIFTDN